MPDITTALLAIRPKAQWILDGDEYSGLNWLDEVQTKPTEEEVNAEIARQEQQAPFDACKAQAKTLIADTDWTEIPSVSDTANTPHLQNAAEFVAYRLALRQLIINPVADPVWPTKPTEQWS